MDWISISSMQCKSAEKECWNPSGLQGKNKPHFLTKSEFTKAGQLGTEKLQHVKVKGDWQAVAAAIQGNSESESASKHPNLPAGECNSILFHQEEKFIYKFLCFIIKYAKF